MTGFGTTRNIKAARKLHKCNGCAGQIPVGTPYESWSGGEGGNFYTVKYCPECVLLRDVLDRQDWDYREYPMSLQQVAEEYSWGEPWGTAKGRTCAIVSELPELARNPGDGRWVVRGGAQ
jgi:hypothetical protein